MARDPVEHGEEAARAAAFGRSIAILAGGALVTVLLHAPTWSYRAVVGGAVGVLALSGVWVWRRSRVPERYSRALFRVFGAIAAVAALVLILRIGLFSPIPAIVVFGFGFFGQAEDRHSIYPVGLGVVGLYLLAGLLASVGAIPDWGVFSAGALPVPFRLSVLGVTAATMLFSLLQAQSNRRTMLDALRRSREAARVAETREAQLLEAREDLDFGLRGVRGRLRGERAGRFRLSEIVGRGAMGEVYEAHDESSGQTAAVKVLHVAVPNETMLARFRREAEIALHVRGPNLVEVFEVGSASDGSPYIAMELLRGRDLGGLLREQETLTVDETLVLVDQTARGLDDLHRAGVVHRDLKPQNLFRSASLPRIWKILDYGVSKLRDAPTMTERLLVGTPGYMSPEQAEGKSIDARSDVFSLGAIAYRVLTGRRPFTGPDTPQVLYQTVHGDPVRPRELVPTLPQEVEDVLGVALAKQAADRWPSAVAFAVALRDAAEGSKTDHRVILSQGRAWRGDPGTLTLPHAQ